MQAIDELLFPNSQGSINREQKQLWAMLLFCLGMKLTQCGLVNLHSPGKEDTKQLLQKFKSEASHSVTTEALKRCIQLCTIEELNWRTQNSNAVKLLLGMEERDMESIQ